MRRVLLVRHAEAGIRGTWPGDDLDRELSTLGHAQAAGLVGVLTALAGDQPITSIASSRATRCIATVAPLADRLGITVTPAGELLEGVDPEEALRWLRRAGGPDVACSHGDVIGGIVRRLAAAGIVTPPQSWPKASTWALDLDDGEVVAASMTQPPTLG